ncbi:hypothetical protein [Arthrobacter sp. MA-N2]|uniref:hypothetical protein n=1 Tax=Arthrobacter sp. MA-N2 TaxID=1101188 RepID=UPI0012DF3753|nr:hypothetical protein [Arthrobacter sp. MA-N2]
MFNKHCSTSVLNTEFTTVIHTYSTMVSHQTEPAGDKDKVREGPEEALCMTDVSRWVGPDRFNDAADLTVGLAFGASAVDGGRVSGSWTIRTIAMTFNARLSCLSPPRFSRCSQRPVPFLAGVRIRSLTTGADPERNHFGAYL